MFWDRLEDYTAHKLSPGVPMARKLDVAAPKQILHTGQQVSLS